MNKLEKIANIDKKFAWSFLGFVLAAFFGGLTIYNEFIKVRDPQMVVEVLSDTNVFDLRENLPELKILYDSADIKSVGKDLSVMVFRIKNIGGAPILGTYYDSNSPVAITISSGEFLKFELINASSEYLEHAATPTRIAPSKIQMPNVIMEPGESYTLKALIIHGAGISKTLKTSGKVAGMREIPVVKIQLENDNESFLSRVFSGSIGMQALRIPAYFLAFIALVFCVVAPPIALSESSKKRGRKKSISQFKTHFNAAPPEGSEAVFNQYIIDGLTPLVQARELLGNAETLKSLIERHKETENSKPREIVFLDEDDFLQNHGRSHIIMNRNAALRIIRESQSAKISEDGAIFIDPEKERFLGKFIDYITIKES